MLCDITAQEGGPFLWLVLLVLEIVLRLFRTGRDLSLINVTAQVVTTIADHIAPNRITRNGQEGCVKCEIHRNEKFEHDDRKKHS